MLVNPRKTRTLAMSNVGVAHTGTTSETAIVTVSIPAGAMGLNGTLRVVAVWTSNNSVNTKGCRIRFNGVAGTAYAFVNLSSTTITLRHQVQIGNRNSASSQVGGSSVTAGVGTSTAANITSSVNTASAVDLAFTGTLADAADTLTLEAYIVELLLP